MKYKLRIASAALLAVAAAPAWALQLGQIQVKSALNQPLVAAIPLHPKTLSELDGLTVALASPEDFTRAGLQLTPTDQTLRFHVVSDNNGQKLILVTSSQPVTDPYLDFLLQVNTRQGKQVREFVVLLNPVIEAPAPAVQTAPVAGAPAAAPAQPAELPPSAEFPQPQTTPKAAQPPTATPPAKPKPQRPPQPESKPQLQSAPQARKKQAQTRQAQPGHAQARSQPKPQPQPAAPPKPKVSPKPKTAPPPAPPAQTRGEITVKRGDTLYGIAADASHGTGASINQMMVALQSANREAFFKDNINNLKAGAILRIPTRDVVDKVGAAEATAEVHRQYETWRGVKPHPATVVEGTAAQAAARSAPKPEPEGAASDHLTLVPPTGGGTGTGSRPGVAGGTGTETVVGLQQQLQNERGTLASLKQSNVDLGSRVQSLKDIAGKSDKLLSFKDATIAELQRKLADVQSGQASAATGSAPATGTGASTVRAAASAPTSGAVTEPVAAQARQSVIPWFERPLAWIVAGVIVVALILVGLLWRRRRGNPEPAEAPGPLSDPGDVTPQTGTAAYAASLQAQLAEDSGNLGTHLALCRLYHAQGDVGHFVAAAEAMHEHVHDPGSMEWHEVAVMGEELAPGDPLFAAPGEPEPVESYEPAELQESAGSQESAEPHDGLGAAVAEGPAAAEVAAVEPESEPQAHIAEAVPDPKTSEHQPAAVVVPFATAVPAPATQPEPAYSGDRDPGYSDDPVDTKLDLARAYLDMGDPVGARAMLDEVIEEGSQTQQDQARRLLADTTD